MSVPHENEYEIIEDSTLEKALKYQLYEHKNKYSHEKGVTEEPPYIGLPEPTIVSLCEND